MNSIRAWPSITEGLLRAIATVGDRTALPLRNWISPMFGVARSRPLRDEQR
jgi:hypothetical protein